MNKEELVNGQYYRTTFSDGASDIRAEHIFRYEGSTNKQGGIKIGVLGIIRYEEWDKGCCDFSDKWFERMRVATQEEIAWLHACQIAGAWVDRDKVISNYEIY